MAPARTKQQTRSIEYLALDALVPADDNPKDHAIPTLVESLDRWGYTQPVLIDERTGKLLAGHGRLEALQAMREAGASPPEGVGSDWSVPVIRGWASKNDAEARAALVADNQLTTLGGWDDSGLFALLDSLDDLTGVGFTLDELDQLGIKNANAAGKFQDKAPTLTDRFLVPPFTVLDARQGYWQARKKDWLSLGIQSEVGRDVSFHGGDGASDDTGKKIAGGNPGETGASIFDPVLCELAYRWFSPPKGLVLDPFAGGSVRGVIAGKCGRSYHGIDLRPEQVKANELQAAAIVPDENVKWSTGDSTQVLPTIKEESADLMFTCPPYYDLEKYSDDPSDLSSMSPHEFDVAYVEIIQEAIRCLKPNRFAVVVTGNVRDKKGKLLDLRGVTVQAMEKAGADFVNDAILVTMVNTTSLRAVRPFETTRSLGRTHQEVLVFCKGDRRKATEACGPVEVEIPPEMWTEDVS